MKEKTYRVINTHDYKSENLKVHEYDIIEHVNGEGHQITTLYRSNDHIWSEGSRGEKVITIIDTGNEVIFPKKEFTNEVGYDKFAELYILISFINKTKMNVYTGDIQQIEITNTYEL
jgi:hypothetical protein